MSGNAAQTQHPQDPNPFGRALWAIVVECVAIGRCSQANKALILALAARVPPDERAAALKRVGGLLEAPVSRGGDAFERVVSFIDHQKRSEWTATELADRLGLTPRQVANVTGYLVKAGRFRRLSRGHYLDAAGNLFVTADELPQTDIARSSENED